MKVAPRRAGRANSCEAHATGSSLKSSVLERNRRPTQ